MMVSPNVANMKLRQQYQDEYNNESETENDSHKSNSKRKQKRLLTGADEPLMKKAAAAHDDLHKFENSTAVFESCATNRDSISSFGTYVQGAYFNDKENVSEFKRPQLVVKIQKPQNAKRKSLNENIQILPVRDEDMSERTLDTPLADSDGPFAVGLGACSDTSSSAIIKQDKKSL